MAAVWRRQEVVNDHREFTVSEYALPNAQIRDRISLVLGYSVGAAGEWRCGGCVQGAT